MQIQFLGATGTVTGSKYLVREGQSQVLVDCGLFQGLKELRLRNWAPLPIPAKEIDAVVLTHAHIDHSGYLPLLVRQGFEGPVYCSAATRDLCSIMLPDSGRLQEEEAAYANAHGFSRHHPAQPLYTEADAEAALRALRPISFSETTPITPDLTISLERSSHILGSSFVMMRGDGTSLLFSGDLGRPHDVLLRDPASVAGADFLILESTYGDRAHEAMDPEKALGEVIRRTADRKGVLLIPAFAVGRTQALLYRIQRLKAAGAIADIPVFLDSPMAIQVTEVFGRHAEEHRLDAAQCDAMCNAAQMVRSVAESKSLDSHKGPMIILAGSGMATGGRILHHIKALGGDARSTILFVGYQAVGTRGAAVLGGARSLKIHGQQVGIRAEVAYLGNLSAHADANEILAWLHHFKARPIRTYVTHGEPPSANALRDRIQAELGWDCTVPEYLESTELQAPKA